MKFPNLVYISPGPHQCKGGTFQYLQVTDDKSLLEAIDKGYYPTPEIAVNPADFDWTKYAEEQGWVEKPVLAMVHRGRGKYDVLKNGEVVMNNVSKAEAESAGAKKV